MLSGVGGVTAKEETSEVEEMLSGEVEEFEEHVVGMAVTGLCRYKGNADGSLLDDQERGSLETDTELAQKGDVSYDMEKSSFRYCSSQKVNFSEEWVDAQWETKLFHIGLTIVVLASIVRAMAFSFHPGLMMSHLERDLQSAQPWGL